MNGRNVRLEIMDWRRPRPDLTADLILASDVAYETRNFDHLPGAFKTLCRQGGELILAEPGRDIARPFLQKLLLEGFSKKHTLIKGQYDNLDYRVNIYHFKPETRDPDTHSS